MDVARESAGLLVALDSVRERVDRWDSLQPALPSVPMSGNEPDAHEERSVRRAPSCGAPRRTSAG